MQEAAINYPFTEYKYEFMHKNLIETKTLHQMSQMKRYSLDNVTSILSIPMEKHAVSKKLQGEKSDLMYNSINGWSLKMALWCFLHRRSVHIATRGKSHHSFPQDT